MSKCIVCGEPAMKNNNLCPDCEYADGLAQMNEDRYRDD